MAASAGPCPQCGTGWGFALPGTAAAQPPPSPLPTTITYAQAQQLIALLTPPTLLTPIHLVQTNGDFKPAVAFSPPGLSPAILTTARFIVLRNFSTTGNLNYWFDPAVAPVGATNPPTRAYNTLPAASSTNEPAQIAIDAAPGVILLFYPTGTTDGSVELLIGSLPGSV